MIKLFTASATENVGLSGELGCLIRICGGELESCRSSFEGETGDDEELLFVRERVRGLGLRAIAGTGTGGAGGEVPMIDENEERGVCERKNCVDVGSDVCGDDGVLGPGGCELGS
jgi:hypothetical protein